MKIVTLKFPEIFQSGAMCRFCFVNLSNLDVKVKTCTNWFIIGFWVLGGWLYLGLS